MSDVLYLDVETDGTDPHTGRLLLVGYAFNDGPVGVIEEAPTFAMMGVRTSLADPDVAKVSHTLYDAGWFTKRGYEVAGPWHDTRVLAWCADENSPLDLEYLLKRYCGVTMDKRLFQFGGRVFFRDEDEEGAWALGSTDSWTPRVWEQFKAYCGRDVDALRMLYKELRGGLEDPGYWLEEEVPFTPVCIAMEKNGLPVDLEATERLAGELRAAPDSNTHLTLPTILLV
jgi:DNA polymerase I-like protein with 3'-5' exonuclease and polymerase domains